jgi:hypothetical protein
LYAQREPIHGNGAWKSVNKENNKSGYYPGLDILISMLGQAMPEWWRIIKTSSMHEIL